MIATLRPLAVLLAVAVVGGFATPSAEASGHGYGGYPRPASVYVAPRPVYVYPAPAPRVIVVQPKATVYRPACH